MKRIALQAARRSRRLTAVELAERVNSTEQRIYRLERGTTVVRPEEAARIADALGYSLRVVFPDLAQTEATT